MRYLREARCYTYAASSGGPACRLTIHSMKKKKNSLFFLFGCLFFFLLPCICFNCFLGSTFLCESRVFNVSCVSRVLLIHAYGCQPHTPFHCMRSETPSCKRKKKSVLTFSLAVLFLKRCASGSFLRTFKSAHGYTMFASAGTARPLEVILERTIFHPRDLFHLMRTVEV